MRALHRAFNLIAQKGKERARNEKEEKERTVKGDVLFRMKSYRLAADALPMKGGRRNLKQDALSSCPEPCPGESLMRVVSLRGSNLIEVEDSDGERTLCMLPAKFRKSLWIKTGNYVLVEEGDREKAADAGKKVTGTIVQVLYDEHVRALRKTSFWPPSFVGLSEKARIAAETLAKEDVQEDNVDDMESDDEEDGLPPLEANRNRQQPMNLSHNSGSDSDSADE